MWSMDNAETDWIYRESIHEQRGNLTFRLIDVEYES